ncbi:MAG: M48 family metalloprotease [Ferroplasma sp.]
MKSKIATIIYYLLPLIIVDVSLYFISGSIIPLKFAYLFGLVSIGISSVFVGIFVYSFTKTFGTPSDKTYGANHKKLYSKIFPEINFELCQKYSNKYKSLIGKDISIYTFKHTDDMPFAFLIENNDKPDIYIEEDFIDKLSSNEMDILLLHELGHYKAHHERKKNTSVKIFIFSLLLLILSYTLYLNTNSIIFFYAFALFFPGLAIAIIVYLVILISMEQISADRFALGYMKDSENYLKFLEKLKLYTNSAYYTEKQKKYAMKDLDRRIKKIKGVK